MGNLHDPSNWRPIAILPILYKIFSKMLNARLMPVLDQYQPHDQIGFRPHMRIENAFVIMHGLAEIAVENNMNVWMASCDMRKALDRIKFAPLFEALAQQGVSAPYINLLKALYSNQRGCIGDSHEFKIERG
eukprot:4767639-Karenia_brevis.AAC.1